MSFMRRLTPMSFFRPRAVEHESPIGPFACPRCGAEAQFNRIRLAYCFAIGGFPLFPIRTVTEYVRCNDCNADMKAEEIMLPVDQLRELDQPWKCPKCRKQSPAVVHFCVACAFPRPMKRLQPLEAPLVDPAHPR